MCGTFLAPSTRPGRRTRKPSVLTKVPEATVVDQTAVRLARAYPAGPSPLRKDFANNVIRDNAVQGAGSIPIGAVADGAILVGGRDLR